MDIFDEMMEEHCEFEKELEETKEDLNLDNEGNVVIPEDKIIGTCAEIFGEKF